mmetsp:Transcript_41387/g.81086  ORF Transcript_41387/g.81086 Transcript_41387/m.81086 type:complete len:243 (+) Transcript_41387:399-1127(+)
MYDIALLFPACSTAATESPPPTTVTVPLTVRSSRISTNPIVPWSNGETSNTPMGPFKTSFVVPTRIVLKSSTVFGPTSRPIHPSSIPSPTPGTVSNSLVSLSSMGLDGNDWEQRASTGRINLLFLLLAASINSLAVSISSSSKRLLPMLQPAAFRKVKASPPPRTKMSTTSSKPFMTGNFVDTLLPPITAVMDEFDPTLLKSKYEISDLTSLPIPHISGGRSAGTPVTLACARWAVPKASLM